MFDHGLTRRDANYEALTPVDFIARAAEVYGHRLAVVHGTVRRTWAQTYERAQRLANGNTLVTLRNKGSVLEFDRDGRIVFELRDLSSPSDADRLPNGNTLVAENTRVREFDPDGKIVWQKEMTWAVEANRYYR